MQTEVHTDNLTLIPKPGFMLNDHMLVTLERVFTPHMYQ